MRVTKKHILYLLIFISASIIFNVVMRLIKGELVRIDTNFLNDVIAVTILGSIGAYFKKKKEENSY